MAEMHRVLKPRKAAIVVVGSSNLRGIDVETHMGLAAPAPAPGFNSRTLAFAASTATDA